MAIRMRVRFRPTDAGAVGQRTQTILVSGPGTVEVRRTIDFASLR